MAAADDNQQIIPIEETKALIERNRQNGWEDIDNKRRAFCLRYLVDYDHRAAAANAGFSADFGIQLLREPLVSALISELQSEQGLSNIVTADFIRTQFINLIPMLSGQVEVPIVLGNGEQLEATKFYPGELVNVLKELAKSTKFYEEGSGGNDKMVNIQINTGDLLGDSSLDVNIK